MHFNRKLLLYSLISNMFIYYITVDIDLIVYIQCDIEKKPNTLCTMWHGVRITIVFNSLTNTTRQRITLA